MFLLNRKQNVDIMRFIYLFLFCFLFFSISSSLKMHPEEIHLTVAVVKYKTQGNLHSNTHAFGV